MKIGRALTRSEQPVLVMEMAHRWVDLSKAYADYRLEAQGKSGSPINDMLALLKAGPFNQSVYQQLSDFIHHQRSLEDYALDHEPHLILPYRPGKIIGIGRNYREHAAEMNHDVPEEPIVFGKAVSACIGNGEPVRIKPWYDRVDHEGEIGVVIGKPACNVRAENARAHIAGYTLLNDVTARAMQKKSAAAGKPWFLAKSLDTFCPLGPCITLAEALPWPLEVDLSLRVNHELRQQGNTRDMLFDVVTLIAYVSKNITLETGDIIATGTPEGVGPIYPGDVMEVHCPAIGTLHNPVESFT